MGRLAHRLHRFHRDSRTGCQLVGLRRIHLLRLPIDGRTSSWSPHFPIIRRHRQHLRIRRPGQSGFHGQLHVGPLQQLHHPVPVLVHHDAGPQARIPFQLYHARCQNQKTDPASRRPGRLFMDSFTGAKHPDFRFGNRRRIGLHFLRLVLVQRGGRRSLCHVVLLHRRDFLGDTPLGNGGRPTA